MAAQAGVDMAICAVCFAACAFWLQSEASFGPVILLAFSFWWGLEWGVPRPQRNLSAQLLAAGGVALIVEAGLLYADWNELPAGAFLAACAGASVLVAVSRKFFVQSAAHEKSITVPTSQWRTLKSPGAWLDLKVAGTRLETEATVIERRYGRIAPGTVSVEDLFGSESLRENRAAIAVQAIYSNLIGLTLLAILFPVLLFAAFVARLAAGPGPWFETIECAGFQGVPFHRRAFRLNRCDTGEPTLVGRMLVRLRLKGLPQLINLVRGEMSLFGPQPVRSVFADRLEDFSPVFARRLSVKPGIFGWAQAHGGRPGDERSGIGATIQEETDRIGYDLYYLRFGSVSLDLEIVGRTLLRPWLGRGR